MVRLPESSLGATHVPNVLLFNPHGGKNGAVGIVIPQSKLRLQKKKDKISLLGSDFASGSLGFELWSSDSRWRSERLCEKDACRITRVSLSREEFLMCKK